MTLQNPADNLIKPDRFIDILVSPLAGAPVNLSKLYLIIIRSLYQAKISCQAKFTLIIPRAKLRPQNNLQRVYTIHMDIFIRQARPAEWDKLVDIYRRENIKSELELVAKHAQKEFPEIGTKRLIWFAEEGSLVIGAIQLVLKSEQVDLANGQTTAMIHHLRIAQDYQTTGIGSLLNKTVEQEARLRGIKTLTLEVEKINHKAREIYKHWGYRYFRAGKDPAEIVMIKSLGNN